MMSKNESEEKTDQVDDKQIQEANHPGKPLNGQYSANLHPAKLPGQEHLHVYDGKKEILSLNSDGTAHDQSHQTQIPGKVAKAIQKQYPQIDIPDNKFIESDQAENVQ